jgi:hypothetical protein
MLFSIGLTLPLSFFFRMECSSLRRSSFRGSWKTGISYWKDVRWCSPIFYSDLLAYFIAILDHEKFLNDDFLFLFSLLLIPIKSTTQKDKARSVLTHNLVHNKNTTQCSLTRVSLQILRLPESANSKSNRWCISKQIKVRSKVRPQPIKVSLIAYVRSTLGLVEAAFSIVPVRYWIFSFVQLFCPTGLSSHQQYHI